MTLWRSIDDSAEMRDKPETVIFYVKSLSHTNVLQWNTRMEQIPKTENIWEILCISWKEENPVSFFFVLTNLNNPEIISYYKPLARQFD